MDANLLFLRTFVPGIYCSPLFPVPLHDDEANISPPPPRPPDLASPRHLLDLQVNVLAYEYSGYGKSEGTVSEDNCYADMRAAYDYLTTQKKTPPKQIVL